jgi:hypothetical protein
VDNTGFVWIASMPPRRCDAFLSHYPQNIRYFPLMRVVSHPPVSTNFRKVPQTSRQITMAIRDKFFETKSFLCGECGQKYEIRVRSVDSTTSIRFCVLCPNSNCNCVLQKKSDTKQNPSKGNLSYRKPIQLFKYSNDFIVELEDYECSEASATNLANAFEYVLNKIPKIASEKILQHWHKGKGSPHVWILNEQEWKKGAQGVAATSNDGFSLYFISSFVEFLPKDLLRSLIAHELGHVLFVALGEVNHVSLNGPLNNICETTGQRKSVKREYLVWALMEGWGFDQLSLDLHIEERFGIESENTEDPQSTGDSPAERVKRARCRFEQELEGFSFPSDFQMYLRD